MLGLVISDVLFFLLRCSFSSCHFLRLARTPSNIVVNIGDTFTIDWMENKREIKEYNEYFQGCPQTRAKAHPSMVAQKKIFKIN